MVAGFITDVLTIIERVASPTKKVPFFNDIVLWVCFKIFLAFCLSCYNIPLFSNYFKKCYFTIKKILLKSARLFYLSKLNGHILERSTPTCICFNTTLSQYFSQFIHCSFRCCHIKAIWIFNATLFPF